MNRSSLYYHASEESDQNRRLMRLIDEQYTLAPFYGIRKMTAHLKGQGEDVNKKRVQRLMRFMGIEAIYQKPKLSLIHPAHKIYPYLLRGVPIDHCNHVWSTDITYIRLKGGFVYLVAILDWYSRYVLSWEISNTMDTEFCMRALENALKKGSPEIFNTDQGSQFTSNEFTGRLLKEGIRISMDGRGRAFDNIFVERLWRTVKYEEVYLKDYQSLKEATSELKKYFVFYNNDRIHQSLQYKTPLAVFNTKVA